MSGAGPFRIVRTLFARRTRYTNFVVLAFDVPYGVSWEAGLAVHDVLDREAPEFREFLNPDSFLVFFASERSGLTRAERCQSALKPLGERHECLQGFRFGQAEGPLIATYDWRGNLTSIPLGLVVNEAMRARA